MKARTPIQTKLLASYVCASLVLSVGIAAFVQSHAARAAVERTLQARTSIRRLLESEILLFGVESAQRGYLLTGDPRYLEPYTKNVPRIEPGLAEALTLANDDPELQQRIIGVREQFRAKLRELAQTIALHDHGGDALAVVKADHGRSLTEQIRGEIDALVTRARHDRDERDRYARGLQLFGQWFVGIGNALAFLLAVAITRWIALAVREAAATRVQLETHASQLGETAERLEKQEQLLAQRLQLETRLSQNLEQSNAALQRSNADLEQFAYVASHDLRAPLRGIASVTEWIEDDLGDAVTPDAKRHLEALRGRVRRLEALVAGIAAYSRAGRKQENIELIEADKLIRETLELVAPPDSVTVDVREPMPVLKSPRVPLQQVFMNLLSNAIKHGCAGGGNVQVTAADIGEAWRFSVRDSGPGIAPEYHERIFGLFQTLAARDRVEGTGIGLAVVKKLVERYGGSVTVDSTPGSGATFSFNWPKDASDTAQFEHA